MTISVHVVEDDPALGQSLVLLLKTQGFEPTLYENGESFLNALTPTTEGCVLLDLRLPDIDGIEVLARMKAAVPHLPAVMMTGYGEIKSAVLAMQTGASDFVEKPISPDTLSSLIVRTIDANPGPDPELRARFEALTEREVEVLRLLVDGLQNKEIARDLDISPRTAEVHRRNLTKKMEADSLSHLVRMALELGIGPKPEKR